MIKSTAALAPTWFRPGSETQRACGICCAATGAFWCASPSCSPVCNRQGKGDNVCYPALYDSVIAVAATDASDQRASFSSAGDQVELAAPGVSVFST